MIEEGTSTRIYVESLLPSSWSGLESSCVSSGGHLVSLTSEELEEAIAYTTTLPNYWGGGNMCPDSPGKERVNKIGAGV